MVDRDGSSVSEVVIGDLARMEVVDSRVGVEIGLDVVVHLVGLFELFGCATHAVCEGTITGRHPTALDSRLLLLVAFFLLVLAEESSDRLHCLLRVHLPKIASRLPSLHELGDGPGLEGFSFT